MNLCHRPLKPARNQACQGGVAAGCFARWPLDGKSVLGRLLLNFLIKVTRHVAGDHTRWQVELRQSKKLEAISQLTSGVAHDFNNLLAISNDQATLLITRAKFDQPMAHSLTQVKMAADRAATLARQWLTFKRPQVMLSRPFKLNDITEKLQALLRRLTGKTTRLEWVCAANLPRVFADENSINQVVMNLTGNGHNAMSDGGSLRITTHSVTFTEADYGLMEAHCEK